MVTLCLTLLWIMLTVATILAWQAKSDIAQLIDQVKDLSDDVRTLKNQPPVVWNVKDGKMEFKNGVHRSDQHQVPERDRGVDD